MKLPVLTLWAALIEDYTQVCPLTEVNRPLLCAVVMRAAIPEVERPILLWCTTLFSSNDMLGYRPRPEDKIHETLRFHCVA